MRGVSFERSGLIQDMAAAQCDIRMLRKRPLQHSVIIDLEIEEVARDVRPRCVLSEDRTSEEIAERCFTPISLPVEDRCSTPTQTSEARCCTPPTVTIKSSHDSNEDRCCTPLKIPLNSRDFKMNVPLAPIREALIARPTQFFNSEDQTRRGWTWTWHDADG
jgi:hypothetical protein